MKRVLVVYDPERPAEVKPFKLGVLDADMIFPGWIRFTLEASAPDWEEPTICWYRVPEGQIVELQSQIEDADVLARIAPPPVVDVTPDPGLGLTGLSP